MDQHHEPVIFSHVYKEYNLNPILQDINLKVPKKEILGIVGPNGAGKTTLFRLIAGILTPNRGNVIVNGIDTIENSNRIREVIGYLPEFPYLYDRLTIQENLEFFSRVFRIKNKKETQKKLLSLVGISNLKNDIVAKLSKGQKQRLSIVCTLIHEPKILLMDEPTAGLDPATSSLIRDIILDLKKNSTTVIINSHNLFEIEKMCDTLAILEHGKIIALDSPLNLKQKLNNNIMEVTFLEPFNGNLNINIEGINVIEKKEKSIIIEVRKPGDMNVLISNLIGKGVLISGIVPKVSLEDVYVSYVKGNLNE
ncbi:ABC transporter ATP-binding protein [Candidatus Bathyarchaeota archaeon]|nr:ABC transporter ATP-binding protein [Candidatus Bathyarchaeota archaeon]